MQRVRWIFGARLAIEHELALSFGASQLRIGNLSEAERASIEAAIVTIKVPHGLCTFLHRTDFCLSPMFDAS